jgi:alpha-beta hydrolase superfamily lysophospholipase
VEEYLVVKKWKGDVAFLLIVAVLVGGWIRLYPHPGASLLSPLDPPADLDAEPLSYASSEGVKLAYRLYEPPGEVEYVLVFLHDTLLHSGWYAELGHGLAGQGIAVYLPDRRGWGHSGGDRSKVAEDRAVLAGDITALIVAAQSRYPQKKIFLGGHGRAAGLVMRYIALGRPVKGVVLISPYVSDAQPNLSPQGWQALVVAHPGEAFLARSGLFDWPVWRVNWPQSMVEADPLIETALSISWMQETVPDDVEAAYHAFSVPLLCVQGEADPLFDPDETPALMTLFSATDKQLETIPGVDYLSVVGVAADPIVRWLDGR